MSKSHRSELRIPLIAEVFHRTGAVEMQGHGTNRVIAECLGHGVPPPVFEERDGWVVVTLRAPIVPARPWNLPEASREKASEKTSDEMSEKTAKKTPGRILSLLTDHPDATIADLAVAIGVSARTIERNLRALQGQNCVRRIGVRQGQTLGGGSVRTGTDRPGIAAVACIETIDTVVVTVRG